MMVGHHAACDVTNLNLLPVLALSALAPFVQQADDNENEADERYYDAQDDM